jgi:hypothetical protein
MSDKRLYQLRKYPKGPVITGLYFADKRAAKAARDQIGDTTVVSIGPDHRDYITTEPKGGLHNAF